MTRHTSIRKIAGIAAYSLFVLIVMLPCFARGEKTQPPATDAPPSLRIHGVVEKPQQWTADQIRKQFATEIVAVTYTSRGQKVQSHCIPLLSLLKAAGASTDLKMAPNVEPSKKNGPIRLVLLAVGHDGYVAAFALAELLPDVGGHDVWVALDVDGKPFSEGEGHVRLIAPTDPKPARWVRDLASVQVIDASH